MSVGVGSMCDLGVCVFGCGRDDSRQRDGTWMREVDLRDAHAQQQQQHHHHQQQHQQPPTTTTPTNHHHHHQPPTTTTTTTTNHQPPPTTTNHHHHQHQQQQLPPSLPPLPPSTPAFVNAKHAQERPTNTTARPHRPQNNHHLTVTISPFNGHISTSRGPCGWSQVPTCPLNCQHSQTRPYDPNQVGQPRASWCSARRTCM